MRATAVVSGLPGSPTHLHVAERPAKRCLTARQCARSLTQASTRAAHRLRCGRCGEAGARERERRRLRCSPAELLVSLLPPRRRSPLLPLADADARRFLPAGDCGCAACPD